LPYSRPNCDSRHRRPSANGININQGMYTVETEGTTDVFLTLFGPDSQSTELASDDDSGIGRNSRIRMELAPGEYFAAVRHYSAFGTGPYSIGVSGS
jgi:tyrosinase